MPSRAEEMLQSLRSGRSRHIPYAATQARYVNTSKISLPVVLRTKRNRLESEKAEAPLTGGVATCQPSPLPTKSAILTDVVSDEGKPPVAPDTGAIGTDGPGGTKRTKIDLENYCGDENSVSESESDSDSTSKTDSDSDSETESYSSDSESESSDLDTSVSSDDEGYGHWKTAKPRKPCFRASPVCRCAGSPVRIDALVGQFAELGVSSKSRNYSIPTLNPFITHVRNEDPYKLENLMFQSHCVKLNRIHMYAPDYEYSPYKYTCVPDNKDSCHSTALSSHTTLTGLATPPTRPRLGKRKHNEGDQDDSDLKTQPKKPKIGHDIAYKTLKEHVRLFEESKRKRKRAEVDSDDKQIPQTKRPPIIIVQNCSCTCKKVKVPVKVFEGLSKLLSRKRKLAEDDVEEEEILQVKRRHIQEEINSVLTTIRRKVEQAKKKGQ